MRSKITIVSLIEKPTIVNKRRDDRQADLEGIDQQPFRAWNVAIQ